MNDQTVLPSLEVIFNFIFILQEGILCVSKNLIVEVDLAVCIYAVENQIYLRVFIKLFIDRDAGSEFDLTL